MLNTHSRNFLHEIQKLKSNRYNRVSSNVDGKSGANNIAELFAEKYKDLYSSVSYDKNTMLSLRQQIGDLVSSVGSLLSQCVIICSETLDAIHALKHNKRDGYSGLVSDRVINACDELAVHVSLLFSSLIVHGTVTGDLSFSTMIAIPKGKNSSLTSLCNYHAITLSSIFGELFDYVVLNQYNDLIGTSHLQFGFKKNHSATLSSLVLKETIEYYSSYTNSVLCIMLDAAKAFDTVEYCKSFRKFLDKKLPVLIVQFLLANVN